MAKKVLSLDNLKVIKSYIDNTRIDISNDIDTSLKDHLEDKLEDAKEEIINSYEDKLKELEERLEEAIKNNNTDLINQLKLEIDALKANTQQQLEALVALNEELKRLSGEYTNFYDGVISGSIFSAGQLDEIIKTAMIKEVEIYDDKILTPELFATKIVALIGNFGKIKAANIEAGDISGHTITSNNLIKGTNDPVWRIGNEGEGWLASGNIEWDADGNVTFGPDVKVNWRSIEDVPPQLGDAISIMTSLVFIRTNETPETPTGGSYKNPIPEDRDNTGRLLWSDGIPEGEAQLWSSTRIFASDGGYKQDQYWSKPVALTDTSDFEVIYNGNKEKPSDPPANFKKNGVDLDPDWEIEANKLGWYDDSEEITSKGGVVYWMATNTAKNGEWLGWEISKIKGEDGDSLFKSTVFKRATENNPPIKPTDNAGDYDNPSPTIEETLSNTAPWNGWSDGIPGGDTGLPIWESHRAFSTNSHRTDTSWSEPVLMADTSDFEVIYNSNKNVTYSKPSNNFYKDEDGGIEGWLNEKALNGETNRANGWTDDPEGEDSIFMATTKRINGVWSEWDISKIRGEDGESRFKSTVFKRSASDIPPSQPMDSAGTYENPSPTADDTNANTAPWNGWSDGIPSGDTGLPIWESHRTFNIISSKTDMHWSTPIMLSDTADFEVIYNKNLNISNKKPSNDFSKDSDGEINVWLDKITANGETNRANGWTDDPEGEDSVWMATTKRSNGVWSNWDISKIRGEDGESRFKSTVFKRAASNKTILQPTKDAGTYENPSPTADDTNANTTPWNGWSDGIPGGDNGLPIWESHRTFNIDPTKTDAAWSTPIMLSDTADFEVIYNPTEYLFTNEYPSNNFYRDSDGGIEGWLNEKAENNISNKDNGWTDEPEDNESVWMATSKRTNGVWADWSVTKIKGEDGEDGESRFKSTVFKRAESKPQQPTSNAGTYEDPSPTADDTIDNKAPWNGWSDGIPGGDTGLPIWESHRTFNIDRTKTDAAWSEPIMLSDTADFEVIYNSNAELTNSAHPSNNFYRDSDGEINGWLNETALNGKTNGVNGWSDDTTGENSVWMATTKRVNGVWTKWTITKIKGEAGEAGESKFKSTVFKRATSKPQQPTSNAGTYENPSPTADDTIDNTAPWNGWSDGIPGGDTGLPIWESHRIFNSNSSKSDTSWSDPVLMSDTSDFEVIYNSTESLELNAYPTKFFRDDNGITIQDWLSDFASNGNTNSSNGWTDDPEGENSVFMATTKRINGVWNDWTVTKIKGEKGDDGKIEGIEGLNGPIIYPAGTYNSSKTYTGTYTNGILTALPYVYHEKKYYVLRKDSINEDTNVTGAFSTTYWEEFTQFSAIYTDILFASTALVGNAAFNGKYIFSTSGLHKNNGEGTYDNAYYRDFNTATDNPYTDADSVFKPNWCVNLNTGDMWVGRGNSYFLSDGSGKIGDWEVSSDGALHRRNDNGIINISPSSGIVIMDTTGVPKSQLALDGSGMLAGGNIYWDSSGKVVLPPSAAISASRSGSVTYVNYSIFTGSASTGELQIILYDSSDSEITSKTIESVTTPASDSFTITSSISPSYIILKWDGVQICKYTCNFPTPVSTDRFITVKIPYSHSISGQPSIMIPYQVRDSNYSYVVGPCVVYNNAKYPAHAINSNSGTYQFGFTGKKNTAYVVEILDLYNQSSTSTKYKVKIEGSSSSSSSSITFNIPGSSADQDTVTLDGIVILE